FAMAGETAVAGRPARSRHDSAHHRWRHSPGLRSAAAIEPGVGCPIARIEWLVGLKHARLTQPRSGQWIMGGKFAFCAAAALAKRSGAGCRNLVIELFPRLRARRRPP